MRNRKSLENLKPWPKVVSGNPAGRSVTLREVRTMKLIRDENCGTLRLSDPSVTKYFKEGDTVRVIIERLPKSSSSS
jgi:hypothetical protein